MTAALDHAHFRLASYGTLAPGRRHHDQLAGLAGTWSKGRIRGRLIEIAWGAARGYPGLILDAQAAEVDVHLFQSPDLPEHWARLDAFEGGDYRRTVVQVRVDGAWLQASIYAVDG